MKFHDDDDDDDCGGNDDDDVVGYHDDDDDDNNNDDDDDVDKFVFDISFSIKNKIKDLTYYLLFERRPEA